ncbi:hypothetical protein NDU88_001015 [Pleurodeles waltl]|uniref:Uncharacterized protein n=1 Tax=Pleurodeles waltl TaxID=8319 RepID=A0AAV7P5W4_PLEWA|nr:hypothetical protein NDU88_001015 [Pleurodeles waltl]
MKAADKRLVAPGFSPAIVSVFWFQLFRVLSHVKHEHYRREPCVTGGSHGAGVFLVTDREAVIGLIKQLLKVFVVYMTSGSKNGLTHHVLGRGTWHAIRAKGTAVEVERDGRLRHLYK